MTITYKPESVIGYSEGLIVTTQYEQPQRIYTRTSNDWFHVDGKRYNVHPFRPDLNGWPVRWSEPDPNYVSNEELNAALEVEMSTTMTVLRARRALEMDVDISHCTVVENMEFDENGNLTIYGTEEDGTLYYVVLSQNVVDKLWLMDMTTPTTKDAG